MKKRLLKIVSIVCCLSLCLTVTCCSVYKQVEKASKNLTKYNITMALNEQDMSFDVVQEVNVVNQTKVLLNNLCFNLYAKAFSEQANIKPYTSVNKDKCFPNGIDYGDITIKNVYIEDNLTGYEFVGVDKNALKINLNQELEPKEQVDVKIEYNLKLANCVHRLGYYNGSINLGNFYPVLAVYEKGDFVIEPYYSSGDPFYTNIANYNVTISYPEQYSLSSSGYVTNKKQEKGQICQSLKALAVRDFAITLTKDAVTESAKVDSTIVKYTGYKGDSNIKQCLKTCQKAVEFYNKTFGEYPYKTLEIIKTPFLHGGMEYAGMVTISDSFTEQFDIDRVIAHEIAHQWWYGVVGNNQIEEAWLDESLTEYSSMLFLESYKEYEVSYEELINQAFANYTLYVDIIKTIEGKIKTSMLLNINEYSSEYEYSYMIYVRGTLMFDDIREIIGKEKLIKALKNYYKKYKFKIATTDDLIAVFINSSRRDIGGVFDSWLSGKTAVISIN